jgi:hypothetical protein
MAQIRRLGQNSPKMRRKPPSCNVSAAKLVMDVDGVPVRG